MEEMDPAIDMASVSNSEELPPAYTNTPESRFVVQPVQEFEIDSSNIVEDDINDVFETEFRGRSDTAASHLTQSDLSRMGMLTAIGDAGSLFGSSVLLSTPSYLNISQEITRNEASELGQATSMEYLDTILENAEYIDTIQGKLPLAEAAKMISQDRSKHKELFSKIQVAQTKKQCYKRLVCIGASFLCLFASFFCLRNLQSSMTTDDPSLGLITFGCLTSLTWFGGISANTIMYYLRPKWSLVAASVPFILYAAANFYPARYTLIPGALSVGLGLGLLWNAEGVYMINLAAMFAFVSQKPMIEVIGKFNAIIFTLHQSSHLLGNLLSSIILSDVITWFPATETTTLKPEMTQVALLSNHTSYSTVEQLKSILTGGTTEAQDENCGLDFYQTSSVTGRFEGVDPRQNYILLSVLSALTVFGCLNLIVFLEPLHTPKLVENKSILVNLKSFLGMFKRVKSWLMIPLVIYPGLSSSLMMADYTKAYITCAYGVSYIGYILMAGACFSVFGAFVSGRIQYLVGRIPIFVFATLSTSASLLTILFWKPETTQLSAVAFVPVCLWCLGDGIILTQLNGFFGEIYRNDLGFALSMIHVCYGIGAAFGTLSSAFNWFSLHTKTWITMSEIWLGLILYIILDVLVKRKKL